MLNYFALGMLFFVVITIFYGVIAIHDIPYEIAKKRNHPQQDALHIAGWVSLFTLHILWPFLWIWATLYREDRGWGFTQSGKTNVANESELEVLRDQIDCLNNRIDELEANTSLKKSVDVDELEANSSINEITKEELI